MREDELRVEMLDQQRRVDSATARAIERSKFAKGQDGEPDGAWSMGEKLLNALVFERPDQLAALGYSEADAVDRLRYDLGVTTSEFPTVLGRIRSQV